MDLFSRFKKDYFNYLLSIIFPALIMGLSIPVLKQMLGAKGYGNFSIWFNAVLLCAATLTGWISQSILRFYPTSNSKPTFARQALTISYTTQLLICLPVLLVVWFIGKDLLLSLLFVFALFITCIQFSVLAISQSGFLSKKNIYSETIRVVSYIVCALLLLKFGSIHYLYALFIAVITGYSFSVLYLRRQVSRAIAKIAPDNAPQESTKHLATQFFRYGAPLSIWFVFSYMTSYIDKLFMIKNLGLEAQGHYQAIFDLLSRTLVVVISPVTTSLFPLLTLAFRKGEIYEIRKLLRKIIVFEVAGFALTVILYWWFGADILLRILKTPATMQYKLTGLLVIAGTFTWLIAVVVHKRFELRLQSLFLLGMVAIAFLVQLVFYITFQQYKNPLLYPAGYLAAGLVYLLLVSFPRVNRQPKDI